VGSRALRSGRDKRTPGLECRAPADREKVRSEADRVTRASSFGARWRLYFRERFPLLLHAPVIAVFSWSSFAYVRALQGDRAFPAAVPLAVAFVVVLLCFLQLRILDEFKDFEDDSRFRPYRPVPAGIVTLRSLGWLWVIAAVVQVAASALLGAHVLLMLIVVWGYSGLMAVEFFARTWLKARPVAYMASHMVVIPLIVAYIAACAGAREPVTPLLWFAGMSYLSFCVFEIGRKIRSPADEQEGVETYSALWGRRGAVSRWLAVMAGAGVLGIFAAREIDALPLTTGLAAAAFVLAAGYGRKFLTDPRPARGKIFLALSGIWLVAMFLALGLGAWAPLRT